MRLQPFQGKVRIAALKGAPQKEPVIDGIITLSRQFRGVTVISRRRPFQIEHAAEVVHAETAHHLNGSAMRHHHVMHGPCGGTDVAQAGRVMAKEMGQPAHAPGFVDGGGGIHPVANPAHDDMRVVAKPLGDIAIAPAAHIRQRLRQFPMIERHAGF